MSKKESTQTKLGRVRPPRVQLTYDVEVGDAIEKKELPFVVGVLGDFAAKSEKEQLKIRDRKFVNIDGDNLNDVIKGVAPRLNYRIDNKIDNKGGELSVELNFQNMDDFRPESIVSQVEPLKKLFEARSKMADLRSKLSGNEKLEDLLNDVLASTDKMSTIDNEVKK